MRKILISVAVLLVLVVLGWLTLAWVGAPGGLSGWSAADGALIVPPKGVSFLPRWKYHRLPAGPLQGSVTAASSEGVRVEVQVTLNAPVGRWELTPAPTPAEGMVGAVKKISKRYLASLPLACLAPGVGTAAGCPADPRGVLRLTLADALKVPHSALQVKLEPDPGAIRAFLLGEIRSRLPKVRRKVLVIGLDAVGWDRVLPYVSRGLMPNLARLLGEGTWGEMKTLVPMLSPLIWTTMATGYGPDVHGILDFAQRDAETGQIMPITSKQRRVPAIWNLASALGKTTDVVGWWATWPAERVNGVMVSDRLYYSLTQGMAKEVFKEKLPDLVFPADETRRFLNLRKKALAETDWRTIRYFVNVPEPEYDAAVQSDVGWQDPIDGFRRMFIATRLYFGSTLLLATDQPDLLMVYIEGTDEIGHIMAPYLPPPTLDNVSPRRASVLAASVPRYFQIVDRWIGRLLKVCPLDEYTVMIISDHSFKWGKDRPTKLSGTAGPTAPLWHKQPAVFLLAGKGIGKLGRIQKWRSVYDVAPTLTALLGIPPDDEWQGRPLPGAPANALAPIHYPALVPPSSYQIGKNVRDRVSPEFIAKMKSLGYLSGGGEKPIVTAGEAAASTVAPTPSPTPKPASNLPAEATLTLGQINNLAVIKINEKKYDEAKRLLEKAVGRAPNSAGPHFNLRRIYMETGRYDDADRELWIAVDKGLRDRERTLDRAAADYESMSLEDRADALLERAIKRFPRHEPFWGHLIEVKIRLHDCPAGVRVGEEAVRRFPSSAPIHAFYGVAAACVGDAATAREQFRESLAINPKQPTIRGMLEKLGG